MLHVGAVGCRRRVIYCCCVLLLYTILQVASSAFCPTCARLIPPHMFTCSSGTAGCLESGPPRRYINIQQQQYLLLLALQHDTAAVIMQETTTNQCRPDAELLYSKYSTAVEQCKGNQHIPRSYRVCSLPRLVGMYDVWYLLLYLLAVVKCSENKSHMTTLRCCLSLP